MRVLLAISLWLLMSIPSSAQSIEFQFTVVEIPGTMRVRGTVDVGDTVMLFCHNETQGGKWRMSNSGTGGLTLWCEERK